MSLAFGTATNTAGTHTASKATTLSDAAAAGDWIVVFASIATTLTNGGSQGSITGVTSTGTVLTFTKRKALPVAMTAGAANNWLDVEVWAAPVSSTINAGTLVVTANFNQTVDDSNLAVVKVTGTPLGWDANASLPASTTYTLPSPSTLPAQAGVSTSSPDTLMFAVFGTLSTGTFAVPAGWTQLFTNDSAGGTNFNTITVVYKLFTTKQTNQTITSTGSNVPEWGLIVDAITSDAAAAAAAAHVNFCVATG